MKTTATRILFSWLLFLLFSAWAPAAEQNKQAPLDAGTQLADDAKKKGFYDDFMKVVREFLHGEVTIADDMTMTAPELLHFIVLNQRDFATPQVATDTDTDTGTQTVLKKIEVKKGKYKRVELMNLLLQANAGRFGFDPRRNIEFTPTPPPPPTPPKAK